MSNNSNFYFVNGVGEKAKYTNAVFPILKKRSDGLFEGLGTGFFVNEGGLFFTAAHVIRAHDSSSEELYVVHLCHEEKTLILRQVVSVISHKTTDFAFGIAKVPFNSETGEPIFNQKLTVTESLPSKGESVINFGFPLSTPTRFDPSLDSQCMLLEPFWSDGSVNEHYKDGRDTVIQPGNCIETSLESLPGASGGPVMNEDGLVFGLVSSGFDGSLTYVAPICEVLDLKIMRDNDTGEILKFREVIDSRK